MLMEQRKKPAFMLIGSLSPKETELLELSRKVSVFTWILLSDQAVKVIVKNP